MRGDSGSCPSSPSAPGHCSEHDHGSQATWTGAGRLRTRVLGVRECGCAEDPGARLADEGGGEPEVDLGGCAEARECLAGKFEFGRAEVVDELVEPAGTDDGVNGGAARVGVGIDDPAALFRGSAHAALLAEGHGPEEQLRHAQAGGAEQPVPHQPEPSPKAAAARRATSSCGTSRMCWSIAQRCPNGSMNWPVRSPQNASCSGSKTVAPASMVSTRPPGRVTRLASAAPRT